MSSIEEVFNSEDVEKLKTSKNMQSKVSTVFLESLVDIFDFSEDGLSSRKKKYIPPLPSDDTKISDVRADYIQESNTILQNLKMEKHSIDEKYREDIQIKHSDSEDETISKLYLKERKKKTISNWKSRKRKEDTGPTVKEKIIQNSIEPRIIEGPLEEEINQLPPIEITEEEKNAIKKRKAQSKSESNPLLAMQIEDQSKQLCDQKFFYKLESSEEYLKLLQNFGVEVPQDITASDETERINLFVRLLNEEKTRQKRSVIEDLIRSDDIKNYGGQVSRTSINELDKRTRSFEEEHLREPIIEKGERPCCLGEYCEGRFIPGTHPITNVECLTFDQFLEYQRSGKRPETHGLCVMCSREWVQYQWNNARSEKGTIKVPVLLSTYYNIVGEPGEYVLDQTLQSSSSDYQGILYPVVAHVRDWYKQEFDNSRGVYVWKQVGYITISHYDEMGKPNFC